MSADFTSFSNKFSAEILCRQFSNKFSADEITTRKQSADCINGCIKQEFYPRQHLPRFESLSRKINYGFETHRNFVSKEDKWQEAKKSFLSKYALSKLTACKKNFRNLSERNF